MSRRERPNLPGSAFHLTARFQNREALLTPELRSGVITILREHLLFRDVELLAYAIMPNHFHVVVRQGAASLASFMQPIMRRTALLVHRSHGREGHVFERRYCDRPCSDPLYLRNAIAYTHLNPVRAGLVSRPDDYAWTSHGAWIGGLNAADGKVDPVALDRALPLFATAEQRSVAELREDYRTFLAWRLSFDMSGDSEAPGCPPVPRVDPGDANWIRHFSPTSPWPVPRVHPAPPAPDPPARLDLTDIARAAQAECAPGLDPVVVRSRWGGPAYARVRRSIILRAASAGYRSVQIAAYLRVSPKAVSAVLAADRRRRRDEAR